ncbi:hypothetical protein C7S14_4097 [Burkholderia cepacia]|nr:hypothetical protein C7S14_4097 [Burkholderia cepacia]
MLHVARLRYRERHRQLGRRGISSHKVTDVLPAGSGCGADTVTMPNPTPCCMPGVFDANSMA